MARWKQPWSDEDINRLRALAGTMSVTMIAKQLGRTVGAVLAKAVEQKISVVHRTDEMA